MDVALSGSSFSLFFNPGTIKNHFVPVLGITVPLNIKLESSITIPVIPACLRVFLFESVDFLHGKKGLDNVLTLTFDTWLAVTCGNFLAGGRPGGAKGRSIAQVTNQHMKMSERLIYDLLLGKHYVTAVLLVRMFRVLVPHACWLEVTCFPFLLLLKIRSFDTVKLFYQLNVRAHAGIHDTCVYLRSKN